MSIPRKKSRRFDVDGASFRFLVKETHVPDHKDQKELSVTIQEDVVRPGRVLQCRMSWGVEVTPAAAASIVREAKKKGWNPAEKGTAFNFGYVQSLSA